MVPTLKIVYMTIAVGTDAGTKQNSIGYDRVLCAIVICGDRICLQELLGIVIGSMITCSGPCEVVFVSFKLQLFHNSIKLNRDHRCCAPSEPMLLHMYRKH